MVPVIHPGVDRQGAERSRKRPVPHGTVMPESTQVANTRASAVVSMRHSMGLGGDVCVRDTSNFFLRANLRHGRCTGAASQVQRGFDLHMDRLFSGKYIIWQRR